MAQDDGQEKTQEPTPKRLQKSREDGEVPRSKDLNSTLLLLTGAGIMLMYGSQIFSALAQAMQSCFTIQREFLDNPYNMVSIFGHTIFKVFLSVLPLFAALFVVALASPNLLGGWLFSGKALMPKFSRMNPLKGLARMVSVKSFVELIKSYAKFILILTAGILLLRSELTQIINLSNEPVKEAIPHAINMLGLSFLLVCCTLIIIAAVDAPFQLWSHKKKLRMSHQEIRDELKQTEVRGEVKGKIRSIQQSLARKRMMSEIPTADVVLVNPTHFSVALRYDLKKGGAPTVVAKGADLIAFQIRNIATEHNVEIVSAPALTRAIYHSTDLFQEIPGSLYVAVAQVLAYIYQLKQFKTGIGPKPKPLGDIPVPEEI